MPGSIYNLQCDGCGGTQEIYTGTEYERGRPWQYRQLVCRQCGRLISRQDIDDDDLCDWCDSKLIPWSGRVWFEGEPPTHRERVAGPCPWCGTELNNFGPGSILEVGLWD